MNDSEVEGRVAQLLTASVQGRTQVDASAIADAVARRAQTDRRRRTVAAVAAAVVVAAAAVTLPAVLSTRSTEAPPAATPSASPTSSPRPSPLTDAQAAAWVAGLPRGADADRPVMSGDTSKFLTVEHSAGFTGAEDFQARFLVAGTSVGEGELRGSALSPDGGRLVLGFATIAEPTAAPEVTLLLLDPRSGQELSRHTLPRPGLSVVGWADSGIVLTDFAVGQPKEVLLWPPDANPLELPPLASGIAVDVAESADSVLVQDSTTPSCVRVLELPSGRAVTGCDTRGLVAISDDGTLGLTDALEVVRIGSTDPHQQLDIPAGFQAGARFAADGRAVLGLSDGSVVACPVDGATCRRFGPGKPAVTPACDPASLVPATRDGLRDPVGQVDTDGAGGRLARFVYVTTVRPEPCALSGYPEISDHTGRAVGLPSERGTFFDPGLGSTPAVIRAGTAAVVVVEATTSPESCPGQSAKTFSDPRLELGNGTEIPLGSLTTYCPVRVSAWHNLPE